MIMQNDYPWHRSVWQIVDFLYQRNTFPHALLVTGCSGIGKRDFVRVLSQGLICEVTSSVHPCGDCRACHLFKAQTYPDFNWLAVEEGKSEIQIDQIRALNQRLQLTSFSDRYNIAVIEAAETMNRHAANALLKSLEEPARRNILILISERADLLPATVRSRCQTLLLETPDRSSALEWLQQQDPQQPDWPLLLTLAQGAPLRAIELSASEEVVLRTGFLRELFYLPQDKTNMLKLAQTCINLPIETVIDMMQAVLLDLVRNKADSNPVTLENPDFHRAILASAVRIDVALLLRWWDELAQQRKIYHSALNKRLFLENLFYQAQHVMRVS